MEKRITILHVIETLGLGGAEKSLVQNINRLPQYRHIVVILHGSDVLRSQLKDAKLINLNCNTLPEEIRAVSRLRKLLAEEQVDLVHAQLFKSSLIARLAAGKKYPFVFTLQSMLGEDLFKRNVVARMMERLSYSKRNYIIAVSKEALGDYKKYIPINGEKASVIYNSVDEKFFETDFKKLLPGRKLRMISVGNLKPFKNHDYLLDAIKKLPSDLFELDIYGEGTLREMLQKRIDAEHLPVNLKGSVSDIDHRIGEYDIYLHCSKYEGSSLAVFEAMAKGLPMVVSNIPVLIENTGGFATYADLSDPSDLAKKLADIQSGALDVNMLGEKGFAWVRTVAHPNVVIRETVACYKRILDIQPKSN
jgi:glycosyltransferase involved in cell wall biosynthesis